MQTYLCLPACVRDHMRLREQCEFPIMWILTWGIDKFFEKLTTETGGWIFEKHTLHYTSRGGDFM